MRKNRNIRIMLVLVVVLACAALTGCADKDTKQTVALDFGGGASSIALIDGALCDADAVAEAEVPVPDDMRTVTLSGGKTFTIDRISYGQAEGLRVSSVFKGGEGITAVDSAAFEARCLGETDARLLSAAYDPADAEKSSSGLDEKTEQKLLAAVAERFSLAQAGNSVASTAPCFQVPEPEQFAALYFYPRTLNVAGHFDESDAADGVWVVLQYPVVNLLGCMDGVYEVVGAQSAEELE